MDVSFNPANINSHTLIMEYPHTLTHTYTHTQNTHKIHRNFPEETVKTAERE